jgi:hypothetical protein
LFPATIDLNHCQYPDCFKVLAFLVFDTAADRATVFEQPGLPASMTLAAFATWLGQIQPGGLLNLYELLIKYRALRLAGRA